MVDSSEKSESIFLCISNEIKLSSHSKVSDAVPVSKDQVIQCCVLESTVFEPKGSMHSTRSDSTSANSTFLSSEIRDSDSKETSSSNSERVN